MGVLDYASEHLAWIFGETLRCVREPSYCLTTVQFWIAVATGTGLILGSARWMAMKLKKNTVEDRLERIEGGIVGRGKPKGSGNDCELVRAHRTLFTRPAFMTSCIQELSILLLSEVINETIAALGTGMHYDAKGQLRGQFADMHSYRRRGHRKSIGLIYQHLQQLQWQLKEFDGFLRHCPGAHYPSRSSSPLDSQTY